MARSSRKMFSAGFVRMDKFLNEIDVRGKKENELKRLVAQTAVKIRTQTIDNIRALGMIDKGAYRNSIIAETSMDGWSAEVGTPNEIGPYLEFGTKPHFPPLEALEDWARKHDISPYLVARAIARRGTEARPHLHPAFLSEEVEFVAKIARLMERIFV